MAGKLSIPMLRYVYEKATEDYLRNLPLEHFMESTPQAKQREITLASLVLVNARRPDVQVFNELLVQFPVRGRRKREQQCPITWLLSSTNLSRQLVATMYTSRG